MTRSELEQIYQKAVQQARSDVADLRASQGNVASRGALPERPMTLQDLLDAIRELWPRAYQRERLHHIHAQDYPMANGETVTIRVLVMAQAPRRSE